MEKVKALIAYNLRNPDGCTLRMLYGRMLDMNGCVDNAYSAQRWCFCGTRIPMPVRSGTWFVGFAVPEMLEWLRHEGWELQTRVVIGTGYAQVYEPSQKGNEDFDKAAFHEIIRELYEDGRRLKAIRIYRYAHKCALSEANKAVREICNLTAD